MSDHRRLAGNGSGRGWGKRCGAVRCWIALAAVGAAAWAEDWPAYRHDAARSGVTAEEVRPPLAPGWVFQPRHAPRPAWGEPNPRPVSGWYGSHEGRRVHFDDAFHVAVAGGAVFFGSSADGKVTALDAATGQVRWSFATGGPVRLAPAVWRDRVYVGSDDGLVYCLRADDGREAWRVRVAPTDRQVLGSGQMISLWPVRTGVLVDGGPSASSGQAVAYVGAGIFPAEGVFLYALRAEDGKLVWCNDSGGAAPQSRISPQGYLLASKDALFVPMGRVSPAAFDRADGRLVHETYFTHSIGGTYALLADDQVVTGTEELVAYKAQSRARFAWYYGRQLLVAGDVSYMADDRELTAMDRKTYPAASLRKKATLDQYRDVEEQVAAAQKEVRKREDELKRSEATVKALDQKAADLAAKAPAPPKELASLKTQQDGAAKKLDAARKALEAAQRHPAFQRKAAAKEALGKADAAVAASVRWRCPTTCAEALILAGRTLFAGGKGEVLAVDAATGQKLWTAQVGGVARGLAVAGGRLFVSTDTGAIYCFGPQGTEDRGVVKEPTNPSPVPADDLTPVVEAAAEQIVRTTGIRRGYALVLGAGTGRLALALAQRTELILYGVEPDRQKVEAARQALDAAGLWGTRVRIEVGDPARVPYADYFANLIVSETALLTGEVPGSAREAFRMLKPLGGTLCLGQPAAAQGKCKPLAPSALRTWFEAAEVKGARVTEQDGTWLTFTRGALPGAGSWTHQYAEPGNTACSDDQVVRCPLGLLWFGEPGPGKMAERHVRAAPPLAINGRLFIIGEGTADRVGAGDNAVMAYDAYNGVKLWERGIRGALRVTISHDAGNAAANADSLFVAVGDKCLRLDAATGETKLTYALPPAADQKPRRWGYVAVVGDRLYGSRALPDRTSDAVFALDLATGALRWKHEGGSIPQATLALGDGKLFFVREERPAAASPAAAAPPAAAGPKPAPSNTRRIVALDAATGAPLWDRPVDLTGAIGGAYWSALGTIYSRDVLLLFGIYTDGHLWRQFFEGQFGSRRVTALAAQDGTPLWSKNIGYRVRPLVIGDTLHAEPWAYDLRTGQQKTRPQPITGAEEAWQFARPGHHCGCPAASPHVMLFRSFCLGWYDLDGDYGTQHFGGQRPGCWINFLPANGLLLVPEASSGCLCPFPNACTVVFHPTEDTRAWAYYSTPGALTPVKHLALNLGAPGDRRAKDGTLWLGFPRPSGSLVLQFKGSVALYPKGKSFQHDPARFDIQGTDAPWVFHSGVRGLRKCVLPLVGAAEGPARYTVRLAFAELDPDAASKRRFDIKLQDKVVLTGFAPGREAGGVCRAVVRGFQGIEVKDNLTIELVAKGPAPTPQEMPILQGIEVIREQVLGLGVALPALELHDAASEQQADVRLGNHTDAAFAGTLRIEAPKGFSITPADSPVQLPIGQKLTLPIKARVAEKGPRGKFPVSVTLLRPDGGTEWQGQMVLDYLGAVRRVTFKAVEDAYVTHSDPDANLGKQPHVLVDGGNAELGDADHQLGYLRFRLDLPGKPIKATLRLYNAGNPTGDSGRLCLVTEPWTEATITYANRPKTGQELVKIGRVDENQAVELPFPLAVLQGKKELSLVLDPTDCDGVDYGAREGGKPAELVVECQE